MKKLTKKQKIWLGVGVGLLALVGLAYKKLPESKDLGNITDGDDPLKLKEDHSYKLRKTKVITEMGNGITRNTTILAMEDLNTAIRVDMGVTDTVDSWAIGNINKKLDPNKLKARERWKGSPLTGTICMKKGDAPEKFYVRQKLNPLRAFKEGAKNLDGYIPVDVLEKKKNL